MVTFSEERIINLLVRHPDMTYQEIGDSIGVPKWTMHRIARKAGLKRNSKPRRYRGDITVERVLELYQQGLLVKDIAEVLHCNQVTIRSRLRAAGITKTECYSRSMKLDWRGKTFRKGKQEVKGEGGEQG